MAGDNNTGGKGFEVARTTPRDVMAYLKSEAVGKAIASSCSKHVTPERLVRVACAAISRQPLLASCTRESLYLALTNCGQLGLEPNLLGSAYLVPYRNRKTGQYEAQMIPGYRGLIELARRSGQIKTLQAFEVNEKDDFS
jgi:recombination protein RecT